LRTVEWPAVSNCSSVVERFARTYSPSSLMLLLPRPPAGCPPPSANRLGLADAYRHFKTQQEHSIAETLKSCKRAATCHGCLDTAWCLCLHRQTHENTRMSYPCPLTLLGMATRLCWHMSSHFIPSLLLLVTGSTGLMITLTPQHMIPTCSCLSDIAAEWDCCFDASASSSWAGSLSK